MIPSLVGHIFFQFQTFEGEYLKTQVSKFVNSDIYSSSSYLIRPFEDTPCIAEGAERPVP